MVKFTKGVYEMLQRLERGSTSLSLYERRRGDLRPKEGLLKREVEMVTFWLGKRSLAREGFAPDDLARFSWKLGEYRVHSQFEIPDIEGETEPTFFAMSEVVWDFEEVVRRIEGPLAFFIIATPPVAEDRWVVGIPKGFKEFCQQQKLPPPFVYKIILGGMPFEKRGPKDPNHRFSRNELRAHQIGGVYLPYNSDYPSVSLSRLVEFMDRVMGSDLPGEEFPNYTEEEIQNMAWHINRENFNLYSTRVGAIPKYPIDKGRPRFDFI